MRIAILGSNGMAGHIISRHLSKYDYNTIYNFQESDIFDKNNLYRIVDQSTSLINELLNFRPLFIINCIRCLVQESEDCSEKAILYNSHLPQLLSSKFSQKKTRIIHLSSDCVFSGKRGDYNEDDYPDGITMYSRSKILGEIHNGKDLTIRTSYIGPNIDDSGEELFHWFLMQNNDVLGYNNVYWTGITTLELAKSVDKIISNPFSGIYHLVPGKKINKFELLTIIKNVWGKNEINIKLDKKNLLDRSLVDNRKIIKVNEYEKMFSDLYLYMLKNKNIYEQYF